MGNNHSSILPRPSTTASDATTYSVSPSKKRSTQIVGETGTLSTEMMMRTYSQDESSASECQQRTTRHVVGHMHGTLMDRDPQELTTASSLSSSSVTTTTSSSLSTAVAHSHLEDDGGRTEGGGAEGGESTSSSRLGNSSSDSSTNSMTSTAPVEGHDNDDDGSLSEFHDPINQPEIAPSSNKDNNSGSSSRSKNNNDECSFFALPDFLRKRRNSFSVFGNDDREIFDCDDHDDDEDDDDDYHKYYDAATDGDNGTHRGYVSFNAHLRRSKKHSGSSTAPAIKLESCWQTTTTATSSLVPKTSHHRPTETCDDEDNVPPSSSLMSCNGKTSWSYDYYSYTKDELDMVDGDEPTPESDLRPPRRYYIITTATIPWMTGTAVNPLLRAAYLSRRNQSLARKYHDQPEANGCRGSQADNTTVTLVVPWLSDADDRRQLYGVDWIDKTCKDQEAYIRSWLSEAAHMPNEAAPPQAGGIEIVWYPARYHPALSSIFALGDVCEIVPTNTDGQEEEKEEASDEVIPIDDLTSQSTAMIRKHDAVCILEEPEHVNFYRAPGRESWRDKFSHVIGIVHTNYKAYVQNHYSGLVTGPLVGALSALMVQAYCDKVIKLSPVLQTYAPGKEIISNVHGIRQDFFRVSEYQNITSSEHQNGDVTSACYFVGKLLFAKGLDKLLALQSYYKRKTGKYFEIDIIGSGPEEDQIKKSFLGPSRPPRKSEEESKSDPTTRYWRYFRQPVPARFLGHHDHAKVGPNYKIFINPSVTEVLCTTTVEAIAMSKWVICPRHPSNEFMLQFPNCLQYKSKSEFCDILQYALSHSVHDVIPSLASQSVDANSSNISNTVTDRSLIYAPLTWEAATERLVETSYLSKRDARRRDRLMIIPKDRSIQEWHYSLANGRKGDVLRRVLGGGPVAEQSPYKKSSSSISSYSDSSST